ncbi:MAG TPA: phosphoribosylformylglycinamidine synthase subunit PurQ [Gemmatimonadota bacterium]|nr:phosphoribosylformylglycinamidine synthase subunit PurQ [Gemmatimonadota bacterium]
MTGTPVPIGVVRFPGTNCDQDVFDAVGSVPGTRPVWLWHKDRDLAGVRAIVLAGGFAYGDYLRAGAIARFSPIMEEVIRFAEAGRPVLGICNGFQILTEAGLLPGALMRNDRLTFISRPQWLRIESTATPFTRHYRSGERVRFPVAHGEGNYIAEPEVLDRLEAEGRVVFRYVDAAGATTKESNPNGSARAIAGIADATGNILGLMPHPDRAMDALVGSDDGVRVFRGLLEAAA